MEIIEAQEQLQRAKSHLESSYLVVGLTEHLADFFEILDGLLPHLFAGAREVYQNRSKWWDVFIQSVFTSQCRDRLFFE